MSNWRRKKEYRQWKENCKERDEYKCQVTGSKKRLEVHHLNHGSYFPEERYDVDNGVTLHRFVHFLFHYMFMRGSRKKCTKKDWAHFMRLYKYVRLISKLGFKN